jgi:hypothetical protein
MSIGLPAYHTEEFSVTTSFDLHLVSRASLNSLRWTIISEFDESLIAKTNLSAFSWGEKIQITFHGTNSFTITSKCTFPAQWFDWGKNKSNVNTFLMQVKKRVA